MRIRHLLKYFRNIIFTIFIIITDIKNLSIFGLFEMKWSSVHLKQQKIVMNAVKWTKITSMGWLKYNTYKTIKK